MGPRSPLVPEKRLVLQSSPSIREQIDSAVIAEAHQSAVVTMANVIQVPDLPRAAPARESAQDLHGWWRSRFKRVSARTMQQPWSRTVG